MGGEVVDLFKVATAQPSDIALAIRSSGTRDDLKPTAFDGGQTFTELWGAEFAPVAEEFHSDIDIQPQITKVILGAHDADQAYPIVMQHEVLQSLSGVMFLQNFASSFGPGSIKLIVNTDGDTITIAGKERQLSNMTAKERDGLADEIFAEIYAITSANNVPPLNRDIITAVVTGTDPKDIAKQVKDKVGAEKFQVIGDANYIGRFKDVADVRITLDKADGQFMSWAKALKLAINLIPANGNLSDGDVKQLDKAFSKDSAGAYHVQATAVSSGSVIDIANKYAEQIIAKIKI